MICVLLRFNNFSCCTTLYFLLFRIIFRQDGGGTRRRVGSRQLIHFFVFKVVEVWFAMLQIKNHRGHQTTYFAESLSMLFQFRCCCCCCCCCGCSDFNASHKLCSLSHHQVPKLPSQSLRTAVAVAFSSFFSILKIFIHWLWQVLLLLHSSGKAVIGPFSRAFPILPSRPSLLFSGRAEKI